MTKSCWRKGAERNFMFQRGLASSCCKAWPEKLINFHNFNDLQQHWDSESRQLEQGIKLPGCAQCWRYEDQNITSYRQVEDTQLSSINIFIDNLCNQMCSYCGPNYSSVWKTSFEEYGEFVNVSDNTKHHQSPMINGSNISVDDWVDQIKDYVNRQENDSLYVSLLGGEPLMQLTNIKILQQFDLNKIKFLNITTNLNPPTPKFLHEILSMFPHEKLNFSVSIDATPDYNHIPRSKFNKSSFLGNLKTLKLANVHIKIISVVSILSLFDLNNFIPWLKENQLTAEFNPVNNPECLHPTYLPRKIKDQILDQCQNLDVPKNVIDILMHEQETVDHILIEQYNYLIQYFTRTGIDPEQVDHDLFKQYWTWLKEFNENSPGI